MEFLRGQAHPRRYVSRDGRTEDEVFGVVDVVRMELLAGATDDAQVVTVRRLLTRASALPAASPADHVPAAALYRAARTRGRTVRSLVDCLVAAVALRVEAPVLARDRDVEVLADVSPLRLA